jgi:hypothetical protein
MVMPSADTKPKLTAKSSMAQPVSQPAVYANGLMCFLPSTSRSYKFSLPWGFSDSVLHFPMAWNSSVGIATRYDLEGPGIESRWGRDFRNSS